MLKYILKRLLMFIPVVLGVLFVTFTINYFSPGDAAIATLGSEASQEALESFREENGLNDPFPVQFYNYAKGVITRFDFGSSYQTKQPVTTELLKRYPTTIKLAFLAVLFATVLGIPLGIISATKQYSVADYGASLISLIGASLPQFWLAIMMMLLFSVKLKLLPATGFDTPKQWIMPMVAIGIYPVATITRMTRSNMLEVIRQDYIRTARAKGTREFIVIEKHALKNALLPVITVIGAQLGQSLSGAMVVESIFSIPGLGSLLVTAIKNRNYPVIQGAVVFIALVYFAVNLIVDIGYAFVDPRIMSQYSKSRHVRKKAFDAEASDGKA